ncbi:MAG: hypothetical protein IKM07_03515 [Clostridia bacterium]|nr:hypothetical protein [Clostridia bacterium]
MMTIAIAAVTAGGKTTLVNELKKQLGSAKTLHFDDYTFEGEVEDYYAWVMQGSDYHLWDLSPLIADIRRIKADSAYDYLILDYPFAYCHKEMAGLIDYAVFVDTPLDVALARRILRDMKDASGEQIRLELEMYIKYARVAYVQMLKDILPSSDYVIDGTKEAEQMAAELKEIILSL